MGILEFILICVVLGLIVYFVNTYLPLPQPIKTLILVAVVIVILVILIQALGLFSFDRPIPRLR
jgi:uncharacterized protein YhhL (DUF1145 family)